jgi:hypothetical protein
MSILLKLYVLFHVCACDKWSIYVFLTHPLIKAAIRGFVRAFKNERFAPPTLAVNVKQNQLLPRSNSSDVANGIFSFEVIGACVCTCCVIKCMHYNGCLCSLDDPWWWNVQWGTYSTCCVISRSRYVASSRICRVIWIRYCGCYDYGKKKMFILEQVTKAPRGSRSRALFFI